MNKGLLTLSALALATVQAQAASDVTVVSVTPDESTTITTKTQEFTVTFSGGVELNADVTGVWVDSYGMGEAYYLMPPCHVNANADKTVWTISLNPDDEEFSYYYSGKIDKYFLRFAGKDLNGEELAGPKTMTYMDFNTYEDVTVQGWQYEYTFQEAVVERGVSDITLISLNPESGTHITSKTLEFTASFTAGVELDSRSGIYANQEYYGLTQIESAVLTPNADKSVWIITCDPVKVGTPDSLIVRVSGYDLNGDSLQVGAIHQHVEASWYSDAYDRYYWQNSYSYGTTYSLGFEPAEEDGETPRLDEFSAFTILAPAGTTINTELQDMVISFYNYDTYKEFTDITADMCQQDANGNFVFTLPQPISKSGYTYAVSVPDGFFLMPDGEWNRGFSAQVYVKGVLSTYKPSTVNPAAGFVTNLTTIDLGFSEFTDYDVNSAKAELLDAEGNVASTLSWGYKGNDGLGFVLSLDQSIAGKYGKYTLVIAEGSFGNGTWNDEVDMDGNHIDGKCNPALTYEYTLYDESNVQLTGSRECEVHFPYAPDPQVSYYALMDTIETRIEFYDNGTAIVKKWAGVIRYDLGFDLTTGQITNAAEVREDHPFTDAPEWTYCYYTVPTGRDDVPTVIFCDDGWSYYDRTTQNDQWWCDRIGVPLGTTITSIEGLTCYDAEGEAIVNRQYYQIFEYPKDEEAIEAVKADPAGSNVVRFYHLNGAPASADAKGMLIMRRGSEVSRIFKM